MTNEMRCVALTTLPTITAGADLGGELIAAMAREGFELRDGDILVLAQKIVSKAEGRGVLLATVEPSEEAAALGERCHKDPRVVELILRESVEILRTRPGVVITVHRLGHIMANAGIDQSNVSGAGDVLLLPQDPDASAARIRARVERASGRRVGVIVSDSFGRPFRIGSTGVALGVAGPPMVIDRRSEPDRDGRAMEVTDVGFADGVAAAAVTVMGEGNEGRPVVIVRGLDWRVSKARAADGLRKAHEDLFR